MVRKPPIWLTACAFVIYAYGQGLVLAPMSSAVLANVPVAMAGAASGMYATIVQGANATGLAGIGAIYLTAASTMSKPDAVLAAFAGIAVAIMAGIGGLFWMRPVTSAGTAASRLAVTPTGGAAADGGDPINPDAGEIHLRTDSAR